MAIPHRSPRDGECWVGVDVGTQGVRAVVLGPDGRVLGSGAGPLTSWRSADGTRHEQDPASWWRQTATSLRAALAPTGGIRAPRVRGVAICATSGTVTLVRSGANDPVVPCAPGLMYDDTRGAGYLNRILAKAAPVWAETGQVPAPTWALARLLWLLDHRGRSPNVRLAHQSDVVTSWLVGEPVATDTSHALKTGADLRTPGWPVEAFEALGVPARVLPTVVLPGTTLGLVGRRAAEECGLPVGTPVVAGMTDGCALRIGSGALALRQWSLGIGTTTVLKGVTDKPLVDLEGALYNHRAPDGLWWPGGASNVGAGALARYWPGADLAALDAAATRFEPANCVHYPLPGLGERFPYRHPRARAFWLGGPRDDTERYAATLQGVALSARLCLQVVDRLAGGPVDGGLLSRASDGDVRLTGGGARSAVWCQIHADVLGRTVHVPEQNGAAVGMAVLAAASEEPLREVAGRMLGRGSRFAPRPQVQGRYQDRYHALVEALIDRGWLDRVRVG